MMTAVAGTVFIAVGAFWLSFTSLADLARRSGIGAGQAWAWPLIVDGIIVVATVAVVALAGTRTSWYPWALLIGGASVSVTANAIHAVIAADADVPSILAGAVAAVPPVVLLAITHLTVILTRPPEPSPDQDPAGTRPWTWLRAAPEDNQPPAAPSILGATDRLPEISTPAGTALAGIGDGEGEALVDRRGRAARLHGLGWANKQIARQLGVHPSTIGRWLAASRPSSDDALPSDDSTTGDVASGTNTTDDMSDEFTDDTKEQS
ncbi:DUF2637 domain-containing protein [Propionibacterium freudenreichii]|nr:DUF2637 domain-containing protein [Propionibacterium freudenreichii]